MEQNRNQGSQNSRGRLLTTTSGLPMSQSSSSQQQRPGSGRHQPHEHVKKKVFPRSVATKAAAGRSTGGSHHAGGRHPNQPSVRRQQRAAEAAQSQLKKPPPPPAAAAGAGGAWNATVGTETAAAAATAGSGNITLPLVINLSMTQGDTSQLTNVSSQFGEGGDDSGAAEFGEIQSANDANAAPVRPFCQGASSSSAMMQVPLGQQSIASGSQGTCLYLQRPLYPLTNLPGAGQPTECVGTRFKDAEARRNNAQAKVAETNSQLRILQHEEAVREALAHQSAMNKYSAGGFHVEPQSRPRGWDTGNDSVSTSSRPSTVKPPPPTFLGMVAAAAPSELPPENSHLQIDMDHARATFEERDEARDELNAATDRALATIEAGVQEARRAQERLAKEHAEQAQRFVDQICRWCDVMRQDRHELNETIGAAKQTLDVARATGHELRQDLVEQHSKASASLTEQLELGLKTIRNNFHSNLGTIKRELLKDVLPFTEKYCRRWLKLFRKEKLERNDEERRHEKTRHEKTRHRSTAVPVVVPPTAPDPTRVLFSSPPPATSTGKTGSRAPAPRAHGEHIKRSDRGSEERDTAQNGAPTGNRVAEQSSTGRTASTATKRENVRSSPKMASSGTLNPVDRPFTASSSEPVAGTFAMATNIQSCPQAIPKAPAKRRPVVPDSRRNVVYACNLTSIDDMWKPVPPKTKPTSKEAVTCRSAVATSTPLHKGQSKAIPTKHRPPVKRPRVVVPGNSLLPPKKRANLRPRDSLDFPSSDEGSYA